ncbi:hypothetical protein SAMN04515620_11975 [Collimonas sp. OK607]|uniref:hypothetical protein n=1 Tax=Collimonas sp. OK607 TaxID=1798194 RepID=UPI0008F39168|nr:hypothetical protein [Collimonas sp. OK607]SFB12605.1 hypothetical protein SAMN04515620_11975 [Collimonas sp. OK607]
MDLFSPLVATEKQHPNFRSIMHPLLLPERTELARWASGFPDRDNKFAIEFQTTFNSSFWEIYLYAVFCEYGFEMNWSHAMPDFHVNGNGRDFVVEAVTANSASGNLEEWRKPELISQDVRYKRFGKINREAMIRLSNAFSAKFRKFNDSYSKLPHTNQKPFVLAIAPFEQPDFQYQYDRAIMALLYDYYVDEDAYHENPTQYPDGPPGIKLGEITKSNGTSVPLGLFCNEKYRAISAVIFSCAATWGKVEALTQDSPRPCTISSSWGGPGGKPRRQQVSRARHNETLEDGLQIFHNPFAANPLDLNTFRRPGVVQHFRDTLTGEWMQEERDRCLHFRLPMSILTF